MQINKVQNIQVQSLLDSVAQKDASAKSAPKTASEVTIDVNYQAYTAQALDSGVTDDAEQIAKARELLASGTLDTREAARAAAKNLLKFGV
ncbi:MAG: hypothetical protein Q7T18_06705 [Sedimentisphaerales bacterium]|nr:hypothetical protein [Sedimentisphaerales bacterium]